MDWSYIAGFFDGEGNFHIIFTKRSIQIICRIYGNSVEVFNEMVKFMGFGNVYIYKLKNRVPELIISKKEEVKIFLDNIFPHLILKKEHALFIINSYNFEKGVNNLDVDIDKFHSFSNRKRKEKFYNPNRKQQIQERKNYLSRSTE